MAIVKSKNNSPAGAKQESERESIADAYRDLEEMQKYIDELTAFLPMAFCAVSSLDVILSINKAFEELIGYGELEIAGNKVEIFFEEQEKLKNFIKKVSHEKEKKDVELTMIQKDGKKIIVNAVALARRDNLGNFLGYFLTVTDISESKKFQKTLQTQVQQKTQALQEKIAELESFNRLAVGRELKMMELKQEIEKLRKEMTEESVQ